MHEKESPRPRRVARRPSPPAPFSNHPRAGSQETPQGRRRRAPPVPRRTRDPRATPQARGGGGSRGARRRARKRKPTRRRRRRRATRGGPGGSAPEVRPRERGRERGSGRGSGSGRRERRGGFFRSGRGFARGGRGPGRGRRGGGAEREAAPRRGRAAARVNKKKSGGKRNPFDTRASSSRARRSPRRVRPPAGALVRVSVVSTGALERSNARLLLSLFAIRRFDGSALRRFVRRFVSALIAPPPRRPP